MNASKARLLDASEFVDPVGGQTATLLRRLGPLLSVVLAASARIGEAAEWPYRSIHGPFCIHADFDLTSRSQLLADLEQLQSDLGRMLRLGSPREPIDVYLFRNRERYERYMRTYFPKLNQRQAMFVKTNSPGNVFAYDSPDVDVDLRHECTHALLHAVLPFVPLWLDEGLAEYFEIAPDRRPDGSAYLDKMRRHVGWKRPPSLEKLEQLSDLDQMGPREYREAWAWVHFMLHGPPEVLEELHAYLNDIRNARTPAPLSDRLSAGGGDRDRAFTRHFRTHP